MLRKIEVYFLLFISYAVIGWIIEVICKYIQYKKFINRGFLIGPYCPIYGFGGLFITLLLGKYKGDLFALFLSSMFLCSILEYMTSYFLEKIFHARWWDYSTKKYNINGRICLNTMFPFGILGVIMIEIINPFYIKVFDYFSGLSLHIVCLIVLCLFLFDNIVSINVLIFVRNEGNLLFKDNTEEMSRKVFNRLKSLGWKYRRLLSAFPNFRYIGSILSEKKENIKKTIYENRERYSLKEQEIINKAEKRINNIIVHNNYKIEKIRENVKDKINKYNKK